MVRKICALPPNSLPQDILSLMKTIQERLEKNFFVGIPDLTRVEIMYDKYVNGGYEAGTPDE